ncbi:acylphosphatase [Candidatus Pacearchaeota archaeon]|nr:acylphosphatase [Candidatus Pacearchaeota archaeon]
MEVRAKIYGRVQGVTFRKQVQSFAIKEDIRGYVENNDDGSVFVLAQGAEGKLKRLIEWIKSSPGISEVSNVVSSFRKSTRPYFSFAIRKKRPFLQDQMKSIFHLIKNFIGAGND